MVTATAAESTSVGADFENSAQNSTQNFQGKKAMQDFWDYVSSASGNLEVIRILALLVSVCLVNSLFCVERVNREEISVASNGVVKQTDL